MIELGELEGQHAEFEKRKTRVLVISIEDHETAKATQKDFPHLVVVADANRKLSTALDVVHPDSAPGGGDTAAPTTVIVDGSGIVRWTFRPDRIFRRLTPAEVLEAVDKHIPAR
jgi:alkyl hydroperoxide reductase subunit AhpC